MAVDNSLKIDVNALFSLKPLPASLAELAAEKVQQDFDLLTLFHKNAYRENVVREGFVESLQSYNRIVGAKQSDAIANLANPFVSAPEVISRFKVVLIDIQRDILVNAKNQAKVLAEKTASDFGGSYRDRYELQVHFIEVSEKMDIAIAQFDAGNEEAAFRIYSNALSGNAGYVAWLSRELCQSMMFKKHIKVGESDYDDLCGESWRSNIGGGLSVCGINNINEKNNNGVFHCAIISLQKLFTSVLPLEQLNINLDHNAEEKASLTVSEGSMQEKVKISFNSADLDYRLAHYCSCDYYFGVCETKATNKETACACDPDCKLDGYSGVLKGACGADDHCDSWCPPFVDPDCLQSAQLAAGLLTVVSKRRVPKPELIYDESEERLPVREFIDLRKPEPLRLAYHRCTTRCIPSVVQNYKCTSSFLGSIPSCYFSSTQSNSNCYQVCSDIDSR